MSCTTIRYGKECKYINKDWDKVLCMKIEWELKLSDTSKELVCNNLRIIAAGLGLDALKDLFYLDADIFDRALQNLLDWCNTKNLKKTTIKNYVQAIYYGWLAFDCNHNQESVTNKKKLQMQIEKLKAAIDWEMMQQKNRIDEIWTLQRCDELLQKMYAVRDDDLISFRDYVLLLLHKEIPLREESSNLHYFDSLPEAEAALLANKNVLYIGDREGFVQIKKSKTSKRNIYPRLYLSAQLYDELCIYIAMARPTKGGLIFGSGKVAIRSTSPRLQAICKRFYDSHPTGGVCNWFRRMHAARANNMNTSVQVAEQLGHSAATHAKVYLTQSNSNGSA